MQSEVPENEGRGTEETCNTELTQYKSEIREILNPTPSPTKLCPKRVWNIQSGRVVRVRKCPFLVSPVSMLVVEFVGRVCEASSCVFFSEGVPSGISNSGCERGLSGLLAKGSDCKAGSRVSFREGKRGLLWPIARCYLMLSADYQKGLEKIVLERKTESMRSAWIGRIARRGH